MQEIINFLSFAPIISTLVGLIGLIIGVIGVVLATRLRNMQEEKRKSEAIKLKLIVEGESFKLEGHDIDRENFKKLLDTLSTSATINLETKDSKGHDIDRENFKKLLDTLSKSDTSATINLETKDSKGIVVGDIAGADITKKDTSKNMQEDNQKSSDIDSADSIDNKKD